MMNARQALRNGVALAAIPLVFLAACSSSQSVERAPGSVSPAPTSFTLAAGTMFDAAIIDTISSRHASAGDTFTARVVEDVKDADGWIAIPAGSILQGTITDVRPAPNTSSTGTLTLAVSSVTVRGRAYDVDASIDSLRTVQQARGIEGGDVARVAGGAVAGAILGRVIGGDAKGTIIGGVLGGAAGAAVSVAIKDSDIVLPSGAHLMLTLRRRITVAAN
jgi:hypothetical protein